MLVIIVDMKFAPFHNYDPIKINPYNIDSLSLNLVPKNSYVLELGCGDGRLTAFLKKKLKCRLVTVELDEDNAKNAAKFASKIFTGNIENLIVQKKIKNTGPFDVVYASAIIGSLADPVKTLLNIKKWIKKNGYLIITFPNILHWSVRFPMLLGKFDYVSSGLCAREHLRFFTINSAEQLIKSCGYKIVYKDYDLVGFVSLEKLFRFIPGKLFRFFYKLIPGLFTYQTVYKLKPND